MSNSNVHVMVRYDDDAAILDCLDAKLNEELTIQSWGEELTSVLEASKSCKRFIINFQNVKFMSSSALRVLITLNSKTKAQKTTLFLCCIAPSILEVFKITKLDSLIKIRDTETEAMRSKL